MIENWLVIFDDVVDDSVIAEFWSVSKKGTIIVTSRNPGVCLDLVDDSIEVSAMSLAESTSLLVELLPPNLRAISAEQSSIVIEICKMFDGLPLAMLLAASFIRKTLRTSLHETLKHLTEKRDFLLQYELPHNSLSLNMLWGANISRLSKDALNILQIMSLLDADNFGEEMMFDEEIKRLDVSLPRNELEYFKAVDGLSDFSLIRRRDDSSLCVHRLLQDVTIQRMIATGTLQVAFGDAVLIIDALFPKQSPEGLLMSSV